METPNIEKVNRLSLDFKEVFERYDFPMTFFDVDDSEKLILEFWNEIECEYRVATLNGINEEGKLITDDGDYDFIDLRLESKANLIDYLG